MPRFDVLAEVRANIPFRVRAADKDEALQKVLDQMSDTKGLWDTDLKVMESAITYRGFDVVPVHWDIFPAEMQPNQRGNRITTTHKEFAEEILDEMKEYVKQPDTDDLAFIRSILQEQFDRLMIALGERG